VDGLDKGKREEQSPRGDEQLEPEAGKLGRREFLKKAAVGALAVPGAGMLAGTAAARPQIVVRDRARSQFEGVTLKFAKARTRSR
jgi:hypothetical protein